MSRSNITDRTIQLNSDSGAVLWSIVQGEQREFEITISSLDNIHGYSFKATVIEAKNLLTAAMPTEVKSGGITTELEIRIPLYRGAFSSAATYIYDNVVDYNGVSYRKVSDSSLLGSSTNPELDTEDWETYTHNKIYIRFAKTFGDTWLPQPTPIRPVYGFFELSVTEPASVTAYVQTYKPVRGLVESVFSPTDLSA